MTKEELIKEAWGEYYNDIPKNWLNENGGVYAAFIEREASYLLDCISLDKISALEYRPKSLQSIENNNGWIKIKSENIILPIDGTEVHFYHSFINENGAQTEYHKGIFNASLGFTSYYDSENYKVKEVTHYQPIEKPKPPLY